MLTTRARWTPLQEIGSDKLKSEQQRGCDVIKYIFYTHLRVSKPKQRARGRQIRHPHIEAVVKKPPW